MDELKPCPLELEEKIIIWDAINEYATACGGNTGRKTMGAEREKAVVACEKAMEQIVYNCRSALENKPLTCDGCVHKGCWENEVEYGYPSPCTTCTRRTVDNYAHKPEQEGKTL